MSEPLQPSRTGGLQLSLETEKREKGNMKKGFLVFLFGILCLGVISTSSVWATEEKDAGGTAISEFRALSQFRSVKLVWQSDLPAATAKSFQITRSIYYEQGLYTSLAAVEAKEGENSYTFVDKEIKSAENYYYKITVEGTGETFGPAVARPFLSQPAT